MGKSSFEFVEQSMLEFGAPEDGFQERLNGLYRRYNEPLRRYHNFLHIHELFDELQSHKHTIADPLAVGEAILYHDAVYDPRTITDTNEIRSAEICEQELTPVYGGNFAKLVGSYVRATRKHLADVSDSDLEFFLDADLAILGSKPERYDDYATAIAQEYSHLPTKLYIHNRIEALQKISERANGMGAYTTDLMHRKYGEQALINMRDEVVLLGQPPTT